MLGFNPNTEPVAMKEWVTPLDPSIYAQGVANQAKRLEAQSAEDSELYNSFMNIQAIAPQDEEQLQKLKQSFEKELSGLTMGDLRNPQTKAQLSQIQNKYTNLLLESGIPQRTQKYKKDIQEVKDLEAKGKFVPAWKMKPIIEAQKYIQDGNFYKDTRFNGQIQAGFDWDKHNKSLLDSTPEYHELKKGKQTNDLYQGKTYNSLYGKFFEGLNQPGALDDLREQFEYKYGNEDFASQDYNTAIEQVNRLNNIIATSNNPILVEQAEKDKKYWLEFSDSVDPNISKEDAFQRYIKSNAEDFARTNTNYALKESKINDVYKMQQDFANDKNLELYKLQIESGVNPSNYNSQAEFIKAASDKLLQNKKDIESQKQEGRMSLASLKTGVKEGKVSNPDNIVIEEFGFTPKEIRSKLSDGNLNIARMIIENNPKSIGIEKNDYDSDDLTVDSDTKQIKYNNKVVNIGNLMKEIDVSKQQVATNPKMNVWGHDFIMTTKDNVQYVTPETIEDFNKIPSGRKYFDTGDNKIHIKP